MSEEKAPTADARGAFSVRIVLAMVVVGVVAFAAFLALNAFSEDLRAPEGGTEQAESKSAVGFAGLAALLRAEGRAVHLHRGELGELAGDELVILTPPPGVEITPEMSGQIRSNTLVILPKWFTTRSPDNPDWVVRRGQIDERLAAAAMSELGFDVSVTQDSSSATVQLEKVEKFDSATTTRLPAARIERLQTIESDYLNPVIVDANGRTILGCSGDLEYGSGNLCVLSDPDFLNTQGLRDRATAEAGMRILNEVAPRIDGPVVFDLTLHGLGRSRNLLKMMLSPPFLAATLCVLFAGLLAGVHAAAGGGPKKRAGRAVAQGAVSLVENSALLVAQANRERGMGRRYAAMIRLVTFGRVGGIAGQNERQQADLLDAVARSYKIESYTGLAEEAHNTRTRADLMGVARRLHRWRQELARER
jgi:hypothetical protein